MHHVFETEWKDYNGKLCIVMIFDTQNEDDDYTIKHLLPGENPFTTYTDTQEKIFEPILSGSAKLSVVANFSLLDEFEFSRSDRYRVYLQVDGVLRWRGFLSNEALSQPYHTEVEEFTLNCNSDIEILNIKCLPTDGLRKTLPSELKSAYENYAVWDGVDSLWTTLDERLTGIRFANFYFPESNEDVILSEALTNKYPIVPYVGQDDSDENVAVYDWVKDICTLLGWTMVQIDSDMYFTSPYATSYTSYSIGELDELTNPTTTTVTTISKLTPVNDHSITVVPGYKSVNIVSQKDAISGNLFDDFEDMMGDYGDTITLEKEVAETYKSSTYSGTVTRKAYGFLMENASKNLTLKTILLYRDSISTSGGSTNYPVVYPTTFNKADITSEEIDREKSTDKTLSGFASCSLAKIDMWTVDSTGDASKNRYNLKSGLLVHMRLPKNDLSVRSGTGPSMDIKNTGLYPIATLKSRRPIDVHNGCFVLNINYSYLEGKAASFFFYYGQFFRIRLTMYADADGTEEVAYWDGFWWDGNKSYLNQTLTPSPSDDVKNWSYWRTYLTSNPIQCGAVPTTLATEGRFSVSTIDTMRIGLPWNESSNGYLLPIDRRLTGYITLDLYPAYDSLYNASSWVHIHDVSLEWCPDDKTYNEKYDESKEWKKTINEFNSDKLSDVTIKMHSYIDDEYSYGQIVNYSGDTVTTITRGDNTTIEPEQNLLNHYDEKYKSSQRYYDLLCEYDPNVSPLCANYGGKRFVAQKSVDWMTAEAKYYYYD